MAKNALPNIFTFSNLAFGIMSILMTVEGNYVWACMFILLAGLVDRYDGKIARFLNVSSDIGKELDSLCDLVSFGVAPSLLVFSMYHFQKFGLLGYALLLMFPISGAYRLARYNTTDFHNVYMGVPITIAGVFIAFYNLVLLLSFKSNVVFLLHGLNPVFMVLFMLMFSYLMVCKLKVKKI